MMDQKIRIRIADREHELKVKSPEEEERTRKSAAMLNRMIESFQRTYTRKDMVDILSFVALNIGNYNISLLQKIENIDNAKIKAAYALVTLADGTTQQVKFVR